MTRPVAIARQADRRADLATIHCLQKDLNLSKEDANALKLSVTRVASSADMSGEQRARYIGHLRKLKKAMEDRQALERRQPAVTWVKPQGEDFSRWEKARVLWSLLAQAGEVRENTDTALMAYVKRQTKLDAWRFLNTMQINLVIESLKKWCMRRNVEFENDI